MNKIFATFIATLIFASTGPLLAQDLDKGLAAFAEGNILIALKEIEPLAEQGNADAQAFMGWIYYEGKGVPQDYTKAVKWYKLAAEQGDADPQFKLALMYDLGQGVPKDYTEAVKWYVLAAEQGNFLAQNKLGVMYALGLGISQDNILAYMWFNIAGVNSYVSAHETREMVGSRMSQSDISKAQAMSTACFIQDYKNCGY
jgi:hypothetical protein